MIVAVEPDVNPTKSIRKLAAKDFNPADYSEIEVFDNKDYSESTSASDYSFKGKILKTTIHDIRKISDTVFNSESLSHLIEYPEELQSFAFIVEDKEIYAKFDKGTLGTQAIPVELFEDSNRYFATFS